MMAKSEHEVEDNSSLNLAVPFSAMYLFAADGKRIAMNDSHKKMIRETFAVQGV